MTVRTIRISGIQVTHLFVQEKNLYWNSKHCCMTYNYQLIQSMCYTGIGYAWLNTMKFKYTCTGYAWLNTMQYKYTGTGYAWLNTMQYRYTGTGYAWLNTMQYRYTGTGYAWLNTMQYRYTGTGYAWLNTMQCNRLCMTEHNTGKLGTDIWWKVESKCNLLMSWGIWNSPAAHGGRSLPMAWTYWPKYM